VDTHDSGSGVDGGALILDRPNNSPHVLSIAVQQTVFACGAGVSI
jgi:hypothetical protein